MKQSFSRIQTFKGIFFRNPFTITLNVVFEPVHQLFKGISGTIKDQVFSQFSFFYRNFAIRTDVGWVNDCHIQSMFNGMVQKNTIDQLTGRLSQPKGDIAYSQAGVHTGQRCFDRPDAFKRFYRAVPPNLLPGRECEGEWVENQVFRSQIVILNCQSVHSACNRQFSFCRFCHAFFIDRQAHYSRTILSGKPEHLSCFFFTRFKVGGVDQASSRCGL